MPEFNVFRTNEALAQAIAKGRLKDDSLNEDILGDDIKPKGTVSVKTCISTVKPSFRKWKEYISEELVRFKEQHIKEAEEKHNQIQERFVLKVA